MTAKRRGREARSKPRSTGQYHPYVKRNIAHFNPFDEAFLDKIEHQANRILTEIGIEFRDVPHVLELWKKAGAKIEGERVFMDVNSLKAILQSAPKQFTQHARNPEKSVEIGGNNTVFVPAYGPPFVYDMEKGRRYGTIEDFRNFVKLAYMADGLHHSGGTVCEPVDLPVNKRHFDMVYSHILYSDKPFMGSVTAPSRAQNTVDMCKILFGADFVDNNCVVINLINANSPLVFDDTMLGAMEVYAKNNQACVVSPFILAGAMSPVSVGGTLSQIYAEGLIGMALTQLFRKGAPVVFGTFAAAVSMQSGAPTFGGPEPSLILYGAAQLARRLGVPYRSGGGLNASKIADAQAGYEAANTLQTAALAGVNFMLHTAGWLEGGLVMGYEKFMMDADQAMILGKMLRGVDLDEEELSHDAFVEVGPGGHFLGCAHTQRNFEKGFYRSSIADSNSFEQWLAEGSMDAMQRAYNLCQKQLAEYTKPELDANIQGMLEEYIAKEKDSFPDSNI